MESNCKWFSRKFLVWAGWLVLAVASIFVERLPVDKIFENLGVISMIYIGANAIGDFAPNGKKADKENGDNGETE